MTIRYEVEQGVATLQIARPEKRNALNQAMYASLADRLDEAAADASVRAVLLTGEEEIFSAGNDLEEFLRNPPTSPDSPVLRFMLTLARFEKPVVAAVSGHAVGIGVTLLLHCDLVYVAAGSRLSMPFVSLGLVPEFASSFLLPLWAGHVRAADKLLLGTPLSAEDAVEFGIANAVLPREQLQDFARETAQRFNQLPPEGVRETKRLMKRAQAKAVEEAIYEEAKVFGARLGGPEVREAVAAFYERRSPDFSRTAGRG